MVYLLRQTEQTLREWGKMPVNPVSYTHLDLYERHGKDLNFLGVVISPESTVLAGKERNARMSAAIGADLGANGAVITEEGYGNPDTCLLYTSPWWKQAISRRAPISNASTR